ncbi:MAG: valine--tRNA ligase [Oscillospiraceae bacterium]|jgi:valyl-tRNA synthetase|nr:valine--tRNA ligase [Oscillospiraceae bacterium]
MAKNLDKLYDPKAVEDKIYKFWEDNGYFNTIADRSKKPYTIVMPPPNITGQLHMGHALDNTLQDILIRWKRMQGYAALWLPGTDHASIATEVKVVEEIKKEGLSKESLGRDKFLDKVWEWRDIYGGKIVSQLKKMGSSCDWKRERFTMDEGCSAAVNEVFNNLYEKGLIYRGERIISWCPCCKTSISDAEVEFEDKEGAFWHLRYPLSDGSGHLDLATTRPETLLGDTAVAVHPDDERYRDFIGKTVILPIVGREIPIVADTYVETDFGTGVVKITPAHDPNDFEVGLRHDLPIINVMNEDATINENGGKYCGMTREQCRKAIVADLEEGGFLLKVEKINHNVGTCYRCHTTVEPRVSLQWFVKMKPLAEPAVKAVREGETKFVPDRFSKIYYNWMENIKDWCISRQLWWGHRIPVWYCSDCGEVIVSRTTPSVCPKCGSTNLRQDEDTLDTWFSSALWPFSTLGWPSKSDDFDFFYPTNTLVTGYDIIFFWVARMIFSGIEQTKQVPFDTVFIHGIIRDEQGRKMSKSLGNGVDPLVVIDKFGADSLRFSLTTGVSPGSDMRYSDKKVEACRNFANKLWNATRFVLMNLESDDMPAAPENLETEDKWIISKLNILAKEVTDNLENFDLGVAVQKLYDFIWDCYCDWYIELAKIRLNKGGQTSKDAQSVLIFVLTNILKLLHPFMPFITEEIFLTIPHEGDTIMTSRWPEFRGEWDFSEETAEMERIMSAIKAIRNRRSEMNVPPSKKAQVFIETAYEESFARAATFVERLASASKVTVGAKFDSMESAVTIVSDGAKIMIPMDELVDAEKEKERLRKDLEKVEKDLSMINGKLSNVGFTAKAPAAVIEAERAKLKKAEEKKAIILESIAAFEK